MNTAIIIGASTGIGRATAIELAGTYHNIAITSFRHAEELMEVRDQLISMGCNCYARSGDSGDINFMKSFISETAGQFGNRIDLLVNNAGISYVGLMTDMTADEFDRTMKSNIYTVWNSCHEVVPYMVHNHSGRIINISSVWGNVGASCEAAYSASKGAVNSFSKALGKELAPSGISVNAIAFGAIDTSMNAHLSDEEKEMLTEEIPAGRMATPEEAATFISQITKCGEYLNGQVITFDGAWQ